MKKLVILLASFSPYFGISQEPTPVKFDDGTIVNVTLLFDDPYRVHEWYASVNYGELAIHENATGVTFNGGYNFSNKVRFDGELFFAAFIKPYKQLGSGDFDYSPAQKRMIEFFPQVHYMIREKIVSEETNVQVKYESNGSTATSYILRLPINYRKELLFDGGLDIYQYNANNTFEKNDIEEFTLIGTSAIAVGFGLTSFKAHHYKVAMDDRIFNYMKSRKLSFKFLVGAPTGAKIVRYNIVMEELKYNPTADFTKPSFFPLGARLGYESMRSFAKKPTRFITWGATLGIQPSYQVGSYGSFLYLPKGALYWNFRLGFGIGKDPE